MSKQSFLLFQASLVDNNTDVCLIGKQLYQGVNVSHSSVPSMVTWSGGEDGLDLLNVL